jgi:hypothetical protein
LQGVIASLSAHVPVGQKMQLPLDQRKQFL